MKFQVDDIRYCLAVISMVASGSSMAGCMLESTETDAEEEVGEAAQPISYNGHDYLFVGSIVNWSAARSYCLNNGYDLATIDSAAEGQWLYQQETSHGGDIWWIGLNDVGIEGTWQWADGTPPTYVSWASNQPDAKYS